MPYKDPCKRKQARDKRRQHIKDEVNKRLTACEHCGAFDIAFMDWHHIDPSTKVATVNRLKRDSKPPWLKLRNVFACVLTAIASFIITSNQTRFRSSAG